MGRTVAAGGDDDGGVTMALLYSGGQCFAAIFPVCIEVWVFSFSSLVLQQGRKMVRGLWWRCWRLLTSGVVVRGRRGGLEAAAAILLFPCVLPLSTPLSVFSQISLSFSVLKCSPLFSLFKTFLSSSEFSPFSVFIAKQRESPPCLVPSRRMREMGLPYPYRVRWPIVCRAWSRHGLY